MGKKRLVIDLDERHHAALVEEARKLGMTTANLVRKALDIPLERQGVKAAAAPTKKGKKKPAPKAE